MGQAKEHMLIAEQIRKSYRGRQILDGAALTADAGECIGIVGKK